MKKNQSYKPHYSHFLKGHEGYLHLCAHSHHFWPNVTREAQLKAWENAAQLSDRKWDCVLTSLLPDIQKGVAKRLGVDDCSRITFASNTHELLFRLISCFENKKTPVQILSTDSEFHSFRRQSNRLQESGDIDLTIVSQFPRETFAERFFKTSQLKKFDMIFVSHVFFNSGGILPDSENLLPQLKSQCQMLVLDTYHSFMARPFSLKNLQEDIYVLGGGYKYLQAGEGVCFLYTPPKAEELRPKYTGWYAHFESLDTKPSAQCGYAIKAWRFWGSTFDPSSMYRLQSVFDFLDQHDLTTEVIHDHSVNLQEQCIKKITQLDSKSNWVDLLKKSSSQLLAAASRGNFLSFPLPSGIALEIQGHLKKLKILTDSRESSSQSFLRLGFGLYHDEEDLEILAYRAASNTLYSE